MRSAFRIFCALLDHNWRVGQGAQSGTLVCARCGAKRTVKGVPAWWNTGKNKTANAG